MADWSDDELDAAFDSWSDEELDAAFDEEQEAPGWLSSISGGLARGLGGTITGGLGAIRAGTELLGFDTPEPLQGAVDWAEGKNRTLEQELSEIPEDSWKSTVAQGGQMVGRFAPWLVPGVGPVGAASGMGLSTLGEKYNQLRGRGVEPEVAGLSTTPNVALDALGNLGFGQAARVGMSLPKHAALNMAEGAAYGAGAGPADLYADYLAGLRPSPSLDEIVKAAIPGTKPGAVAGVALTPLGRFGRSRAAEAARANDILSRMEGDSPAPDVATAPPAAPVIAEPGPAPEGAYGRAVLEKWQASHPGEHNIRPRGFEESWPDFIPNESAKTTAPDPIPIEGKPRADIDADKLIKSDFAEPKEPLIQVAESYRGRDVEAQAGAQKTLERIDVETKPVLYDASGRQITGYGATPDESLGVVAPFTKKGTPRASLDPQERAIAEELTAKGYQPKAEIKKETPRVIRAGMDEQPLMLPEPQKKLPAPTKREVDADKILAEESFAKPMEVAARQASKAKIKQPEPSIEKAPERQIRIPARDVESPRKAGIVKALEEADAAGQPAAYDGEFIVKPTGRYEVVNTKKGGWGLKLVQKLSNSKELTERLVMQHDDPEFFAANRTLQKRADEIRAKRAQAQAAAEVRAEEEARVREQEYKAEQEIKAEVDEGAKKAKFVKGAVTIRFADEQHTIPGAEIDGWVIHRPINEEGKPVNKGYVVTHKASGMRAATRTNLQEARRLAYRLAKDIPAASIDAKGKAPRETMERALDIVQNTYAVRNRERGATTLFTNDIADGLGWLSNAIQTANNDNVPPVKIMQVEGGGKVTEIGRPQSERYGTGNIGLNPFSNEYNFRTNVTKPIHKTLAVYRKAFALPSTLAEKFKEYRRTYQAADHWRRNVSARHFDLKAKFAPYLALKDKSAVNAFLQKQNDLILSRRAVPETPEALTKLGLKPEEIAAVRAWRDTFEFSWDMTANAMKADPPASVDTPEKLEQFYQKVDEWKESKRQELYMPRSRHGSYFVYAPDAPDGGWFSMHEKKSDMVKTARELSQKGYAVREGQYMKNNHGAYDELPPDFLASMGDLDADRPAPNREFVEGFKGHLLRAKRVQGFSQDLERSAAEYLSGAANFYAHKVANAEFKEAMKDLVPGSALYKQAEKLKASLKDPSVFPAVRKFYAVWYLTRPLSAAVNMAQSLAVTLPRIIREEGFIDAAQIYAQAVGKSAKYFATRKAFAKADPALSEAIFEARRQGIIGSGNMDELKAKAAGKAASSPLDYGLALFSGAEYANRLHAFIAGWDMAARKGLSGSARFEYANDIVNKTQFDYSKANRPEIARGWKAAPMTFRLFSGNMLRAIRDNAGLSKNQMEALAVQLGIVTALGGTGAMFGVKEIKAAFKAMGYNPDKAERDFAKKYFGEKGADAVQYGIPGMYGFSIAGNLAAPELAPEIEEGVVPALGRLAFGVTADLPQRFARAKMLYDRGATEGKGLMWGGEALDQLLPPVARNQREAYRASQQGFRSPATNAVLVENPTDADIAWKSFGGSPTSLSKAYAENQTLYRLGERARDNGEINQKLARALFENNQTKVNAILAEIEEHNRNVDSEVDLWRPDTRTIRLLVADMTQRNAGTMRRLPKKARGEAAEALR